MKYKNLKNDEIMLSGISEQSLVNGVGLRKVYFSQGCNHHCDGCFNPETWKFSGGKIFKINDLVKELKKESYLDGISFSGGDPMEQADKFSSLAAEAKKMNLNIWCWTGYKWEELMIKAKDDKTIVSLLKNIDVLIDGRFVLKLKTDKCIYRGSSNQRIIDVDQSFKKKKVVLFKI